MFNQDVHDAAKAHAVSQFPNEACGMVVGDAYVPCLNVHATPSKSFTIDPDVINPHIINKTLQAVLHSHPYLVLTDRSSPSAGDMESQISQNVPYGIIDTDGTVVNDPYYWGDFKLEEKLIGVEFHHGVDDCYTTVRKWFWQKKGIKLRDIPRDYEWWQNEQDLYINGFESCGFVRITKQDLRDGDCILGKMGRNILKINHAGVYLDNAEDGKGLILHHTMNRLSARVPAGAFINRADLFLRYNAD